MTEYERVPLEKAPGRRLAEDHRIIVGVFVRKDGVCVETKGDADHGWGFKSWPVTPINGTLQVLVEAPATERVLLTNIIGRRIAARPDHPIISYSSFGYGSALLSFDIKYGVTSPWSVAVDHEGGVSGVLVEHGRLDP